MKSQIEQRIITLHILPSISRNKANQAMKFDELKEHNMKNNFLQKLCRK